MQHTLYSWSQAHFDWSPDSIIKKKKHPIYRLSNWCHNVVLTLWCSEILQWLCFLQLPCFRVCERLKLLVKTSAASSQLWPSDATYPVSHFCSKQSTAWNQSIIESSHQFSTDRKKSAMNAPWVHHCSRKKEYSSWSLSQRHKIQK